MRTIIEKVSLQRKNQMKKNSYVHISNRTPTFLCGVRLCTPFSKHFLTPERYPPPTQKITPPPKKKKKKKKKTSCKVYVFVSHHHRFKNFNQNQTTEFHLYSIIQDRTVRENIKIRQYKSGKCYNGLCMKVSTIPNYDDCDPKLKKLKKAVSKMIL